MRDLLKPKEYFDKYLDYQNSRILKFEDLLTKAINEKGESFEGVRKGRIALLNFYLDKVNALYSVGEPIDQIKEVYPAIINHFTNIWNKDGSYITLLKVLSLGVLLNISKKDMEQVIELIKSNIEMPDCLIGVLIQHFDESSLMVSDKVPTPYNYLTPILHDCDDDKAFGILKSYLENKWYIGHNDTGWYNSHKGDKDIYSGYWSFESGAIAKILKLNDSSLKGTSYYPYDLVHY